MSDLNRKSGDFIEPASYCVFFFSFRFEEHDV